MIQEQYEKYKEYYKGEGSLWDHLTEWEPAFVRLVADSQHKKDWDRVQANAAIGDLLRTAILDHLSEADHYQYDQSHSEVAEEVYKESDKQKALNMRDRV